MQRLQGLLIAVCLVAVSGPATAEYREMEVKDGGRIIGHVRVVGDVPALPPQPVFKEKEVCGTSTRDERLVVGPAGTLANAVAYIRDVKAGKAVPRDQAVTLDNVKCAFVPHVTSGSVGQMLKIHNSDPFLHDAHALLGSRTLFNVAVPKGLTVRKPLADAGLIHLNCNIRHTWMHAYVYVTEHPYHAVSGNDGQFVIDQIPPGKYTVTVWHELLGSTEREVTVEPGKTTTLDIEFPATARVETMQEGMQ